MNPAPVRRWRAAASGCRSSARVSTSRRDSRTSSTSRPRTPCRTGQAKGGARRTLGERHGIRGQPRDVIGRALGAEIRGKRRQRGSPEHLDLLGQRLSRAIVVDHEIGRSPALRITSLRTDPRIGLIRRQTPRHQATHPHGLVRRHDHHDVIIARHPLLHQQGHVVHDDAVPGRGELLRGLGPDQGMRDRFQARQSAGIGKDDPGESGPVEAAVRRADGIAEGRENRGQTRRARRHDRPGDLVGIDQDRAPLHEQGGDRGLAGADPTAQSDPQHASSVVTFTN